MNLDLEFDAEQEALAQSVRGFCARHVDDASVRATADTFPADIWRGMAELGVLGLATPEGGGGALEVAAAMEQLGAANTPGPFVATFMATQLLDAETRAGVVDGSSVVSLGCPPLMPWSPVATIFVELSDTWAAWLAAPVGNIEPVDTLAGEPWGRVTLERTRDLGDATRAIALGDTAAAAYLVGAARRLLTTSAEYARDRLQFGQAIGDFQAVAHPLADVAMRVDAAQHLARIAAYALDNDQTGWRTAAATARLSATRSALAATYRAHQTLGAMGYTVEGPVAHVGQRIRQVSLLPPGPNAAREAVLLAHV